MVPAYSQATVLATMLAKAPVLMLAWPLATTRVAELGKALALVPA